MKSLYILFLIVFIVSISAQNRWQKLNGPEGGTISALITKGDTIIAGTGYYKALLFYSTNRGASWEKVDFKTFASQGGSRFNDFQFTDDGGIIAVTGYTGIYKSFDLLHWTKLLSNGEDFWSLGKDAYGTLYTGTDYGNIYYSTNNGNNWVLINKLGINRICSFFLNNDSTLYAGGSGQILKKKYNSTQWDTTNFSGDNTLCFVCKDDSDNLYIQNSNTIMLSTDNGTSWHKQDKNWFFHGNFIEKSIYTNNRLIFFCDDETEYFGTGWGVTVSTDKGLTWRWSNYGIGPKLEGGYAITKSGNDVFLGTYSAGVFKSTDFGDSWFRVNNGIYAADVWNINFDTEGTIYAACNLNGIQKSTDKGLTWKLINNGLPDTYFTSVFADNYSVLFASSYVGGTFKSTDKGENWTYINGNYFVNFFNDDQNRIYGMGYGGGLQRTTDEGNSWIRLDKGFINSNVYSLVLDSSKNIYAGTYGAAIYKSTDDGNSWTTVYQSTLGNISIGSMAIAPNGSIFAYNDGYGILRSTDNGLTWELVLADGGNQNVTALNINKNGEIFASSSNNQFYSSTDNGNTWKSVLDNMTFCSIQDIKFDKDDTMYIATDESVWRSNPDNTIGIRDKSTVILQYSLSQNYPNPFNPSTTINYSVKNAGLVKINIYDILGRDVESLVNEKKQPGNYSVTFNAKSITSGVYFYKLEINDYALVKKMIFLK
jgi:photosystem II stability/assembly factor-like uncharacterized protein